MKRIIALTLSTVFMFTFFAACGKKKEEMKEDIKEELTTIKDDVSDAVDDSKNDTQGMMDDLMENGNVTNQTGEGALQEALTDVSEMLEGDDKNETEKETERNR